jgi:hypothetical protein
MKRIWKIIGVIGLVVAILLLIGPLVYPIPPLTDTLPEQSLADADSRFAEIDNLTIHYKETGQGEPVFILLHGFGASEFSWREVAEPLSRKAGSSFMTALPLASRNDQCPGNGQERTLTASRETSTIYKG